MASSPPLAMEERPPPEKKQKQGDDHFMSYFDKETEEKLYAEMISNLDGHGSDEDSEVSDSEEEEYFAALRDSDGFDVPYFTWAYYSHLLTPIVWNENEKSPEYLFPFAVAGIDLYNEEHGTNYKVVLVEKCMQQAGRGIKYYITFHATIVSDNGSGAPKPAADSSEKAEIFEAFILRGIPKKKGDNPIEAIFCRTKGTRKDDL
ncbi:hypothetical protein REPUB_Repub03eG0069600 [Reevesia pubescens]